MYADLWGAGLATPTPTMTVDPEAVTPGFVGFVAIGLVAIVAILLVVDMLRRIRRAGYRAEVNEELDAEAAAAAQADAATRASDVDDQDIDPAAGEGPQDGTTGGPRGA